MEVGYLLMDTVNIIYSKKQLASESCSYLAPEVISLQFEIILWQLNAQSDLNVLECCFCVAACLTSRSDRGQLIKWPHCPLQSAFWYVFRFWYSECGAVHNNCQCLRTPELWKEYLATVKSRLRRLVTPALSIVDMCLCTRDVITSTLKLGLTFRWCHQPVTCKSSWAPAAQVVPHFECI